MLRAYQVSDIRRAEEAGGDALMRQAAFAIAARAADLLVDLAGGVYGSTVLLLVGPGANGGDALFAGADLARRGARVLARCSHMQSHVEGMHAFQSAGGEVVQGDGSNITSIDLVVDGIYGMGARGALAEELRPLIAITESVFTLSIDLPSGVVPDTGVVDGLHVQADLTLATGALKTAHLIDPARTASGVIEVIDLGLQLHESVPAVSMWQRADVAAALVPIDPTLVDKYRRGVLALLAGSKAYPGAGLLAAQAAIATGAGMVRHLGAVDLRSEVPELVSIDGQAQALAIGPGLTDGERDQAVELLARDLPAVVDAGATAWVTPGRADTVITPHAGELVRLLDVERSAVEAQRLNHLRQAADRLGVTVLLKGSTTLIATADGQVFANPTGSPALATAGSGDVLTGMIGGLLAQGLSVVDAAICAAWLHGVAGAYAQSGASGIIEMIPAALAMVEADHNEY